MTTELNVLVACEFSGVVRRAFRRLGHNAYSCDLLPCEDQENASQHIEGDAIAAINTGVPGSGQAWDMLIAHPPCTYLCSSGLHWNKNDPVRQAKTEDALDFVRAILDSGVPRICLENPVGCISTRVRKYDQMIQPWQFGEDASKRTCLWLVGLSPLRHTRIIPPRGWMNALGGDYLSGMTCKTVCGYKFATATASKRPVWGNQTASGQNKLGPSPDRWKERSRTYEGIASAMAEQWGGRLS